MAEPKREADSYADTQARSARINFRVTNHNGGNENGSTLAQPAELVADDSPANHNIEIRMHETEGSEEYDEE